jgi:hypothetical protein
LAKAGEGDLGRRRTSRREHDRERISVDAIVAAEETLTLLATPVLPVPSRGNGTGLAGLGSGRPDRRLALGLLGVLAGPPEALDELGGEVGIVELHRHQAFREKDRVASVRGVCDDHDVRHRSCSCAELTRWAVRSVGRGLKVIAGSFSAQKARVCGPSRCQ